MVAMVLRVLAQMCSGGFILFPFPLLIFAFLGSALLVTLLRTGPFLLFTLLHWACTQALSIHSIVE